MAKTQTRPWNPAEHLETEEDMAAYLEAAFEEDDPGLIAAVLGDIAKAKGMTQVAAEAGLGRESLYKSLSPNGNPEFITVLKVVRTLGLRLRASPASGPTHRGTSRSTAAARFLNQTSSEEASQATGSKRPKRVNTGMKKAAGQ